MSTITGSVLKKLALMGALREIFYKTAILRISISTPSSTIIVSARSANIMLSDKDNVVHIAYNEMVLNLGIFDSFDASNLSEFSANNINVGDLFHFNFGDVQLDLEVHAVRGQI